MDPSREIGRWLLIAGVFLIVLGAVFFFGSRILPLGRLPGDIRIEGKHFSLFFPIVTSIVVSIILTLILNLILSSRR